MLRQFVGNSVRQHVPKAATMRDKIIHGSRVYSLSDCRNKTLRAKNAIEVLRDTNMQDLDCDPWNQLSGKKKASLVWLDLKQSLVVFK